MCDQRAGEVAPVMVRVGDTGSVSAYVWQDELAGKISEVVFTDGAGNALSIREYAGPDTRVEVSLPGGRVEVVSMDGTIQLRGLSLMGPVAESFSFEVREEMSEEDLEVLRQSPDFATFMGLVTADANSQLREALVAFLLSQGWVQQAPGGELIMVPDRASRWECFVACLVLGAAILAVGPACAAGPLACYAAIVAVIAAYQQVQDACG